jgi:hypothetical protein
MAIPFAIPAALKTWWAAIVLALAVAFAVQTARIEGFKAWPISVKGYKAELQSERDARVADRRKYREAQGEAQAKNRAQLERIKSEQEKISADQQSKYERDLARLRAGGVRKEFAAPPGSPGRPGTGPNAVSTCRADEQNVCVPRSVIVRAAEIELGRNALIDWINLQLGVKR